MTNSKISIIVPCYNQAQYLDECLQSVLDQTYSDWECIIVNDGSPDNTEEVTKNWTEKDDRFKYIHKKNGGLSSARNAGIEIARGEFILPLDADDKIAKNYCELAVAEFKKDKDLKLVYCLAEKFGEENGLWELSKFSLRFLASGNMIFCSAFFKKSDWESIGGYDVKMIYGLEDWEFWINLLKSSGKVKKIEQICFYYRVKKNSMIKSLNNQQSDFLNEYMSIKHADFFVAQLGSFNFLVSQVENYKKENEDKLKSEKYVIDLFCKTFFGFSVFKKYVK